MIETLLEVSKKMMDLLVTDLTKHSLTTSQFFLLGYLRDIKRPVPMHEIALFMQHSTAATTGMIDRLQLQGVVKRKSTSKDRRVMLVNITDKGIQTLGKLNEHMKTLCERMLALLTPEEKSVWININQKILGFSDQAPPVFQGLKNLPRS